MDEQNLTPITSDRSGDSSQGKSSGLWLNRKCRSMVLSRLGRLDQDSLCIVDDDGSHWLGKPKQDSATVEVHDRRFWRMMATGGSVGAGEAYVAGLWDSPDLTRVVQVLAKNRDVLSQMEQGTAKLSRLPLAWLHRMNRNNLEGSRKNISAHYDLGNSFFARWLDQRMQYSSALFLSADDTLDRAQQNKLARIAQQLELGPADHLLEIGAGWGGLAIYMAQHTGCRVTTTTISQRQFDYATAQVAEAGLDDRIEVLLRDYRELTGQYDKLVSVEMIEAVGANYLDTYIQTVAERLKPNGLALIQAITIEDFRYAGALDRVDFLQRYIFPGSFIPSLSAITASMVRQTDLALLNLFDMGASYPRTLASWRVRFEDSWDTIKAEYGFDEAFRRRWRYYLCYCEGGFLERAISDVQLLFARPMYRKPSLPMGDSAGAS
ncbi:MAG: cyclopropane-fatty-acyl-phospholipid synthase family protein [Pseudomonadota bacterium]